MEGRVNSHIAEIVMRAAREILYAHRSAK